MTFANIRRRMARFVRDETGLAAVEYAVMAVIVVGVVVAAAEPLRTAVTDAFKDAGEAIGKAGDAAAGGGGGT
ncbi:Flp family type IVb pilin [Caulobacter sp. 73W]|uniref:Flp family type IVb pilin n=1 Tax=Caulobacter sp. 73W TaxID=3161137 RepID=A0AB39KP48_9CAUL